MPVYQCLIQQNSLSAEQKRQVSREITRIHSEVTGAPAIFVDVIFDEVPRGDWFTGGEPSSRSIIQANIRAGRSDEKKARLMAEISRSWNQVTGQREEDLEIAVTDFQARYLMRVGMLLPEDGQEQQWLARLKAAAPAAGD
jgi:4-oxalocrotonate tautomerase family enzyme